MFSESAEPIVFVFRIKAIEEAQKDTPDVGLKHYDLDLEKQSKF